MSEPRSWNETANIVEKAKKEVGTSISTAKDEIISEVKKAAESGSSASGVQTFTSDGTFTVPADVHKILITACAGGQAGYYGSGDSTAEGGDGGDWIFRQPYSVVPKSSISITVGQGGKSSGAKGGSTVIGTLVTLACPGIRGGRNNPYTDGSDGFAAGGFGKRLGNSSNNRYGGGGGGSLGRGGDAGSSSYSDGKLGGGGGGNNSYNGGGVNHGGDGIVIIEW